MVSLWIIQDSTHRLEVWEQVAITYASVQLMGWPVECACSARAEVARSLYCLQLFGVLSGAVLGSYLFVLCARAQTVN